MKELKVMMGDKLMKDRREREKSNKKFKVEARKREELKGRRIMKKKIISCKRRSIRESKRMK